MVVRKLVKNKLENCKEMKKIEECIVSTIGGWGTVHGSIKLVLP